MASLRAVAETLRQGKCPPDAAFDHFLPKDLQMASEWHWTPLAVSVRVARWLNRIGAKTVVDLGAGPGKFCVPAALATSCHFIGIEQRSHLVAAARELAQRFGVADRLQFIQSELHECDIPIADAYYLYNPFGENLLDYRDRVDDDVELSSARYHRDVELVEAFLERTPVGTHVVKYNGFGGMMPTGYEIVCSDHRFPTVLRLWRKAQSAEG